MHHQMLQAQRKGKRARRPEGQSQSRHPSPRRRVDAPCSDEENFTAAMVSLLASSVECYVPGPHSRPFLPELFMSVARALAQLPQCFLCPSRMRAFLAGRVTSSSPRSSGKSYATNGRFMSWSWPLTTSTMGSHLSGSAIRLSEAAGTNHCV